MSEPTNEQIRFAVAKCLGWVAVRNCLLVDRFWQVGYSPSNPFPHDLGEQQVPDWTEDLDECHKAWHTLDRKERTAHSRILREIVVADGGHAASFNEDIVACVENATARQRCLAFLRTKGVMV